MEKFTPIPLSDRYNASLSEPYPSSGGRPRWDDGSVNALGRLSLAEVTARGIPFSFSDRLIVLPAPTEGKDAGDPVVVPIGKEAHYVCITLVP